MKIAFLVWRFPVVSEPFILNQIIGLLDRGHEVHIYPLNGKPDNLSKIHPLVEQYNLFDRTYYPPTRPENLLHRYLKGLRLLLKNLHRGSLSLLQIPKLFKYNHEVLSLKWLYRAMLFLEREEYDIIHCQFGTLSAMGLLFRDLGILPGKLIVTFRGIDISRYVQEKGEKVYDQLFAEGDFFLANCEFFRQKAIQLGCNPQKIVVHGSGIDCRKFAFKPRYFPADGCIRIATTGRLVEKKGIEYCIRAIAKLAQTYPDIEFNIIGDGPLKQDFEKLIQQLNLTHLIKLLGWKQQQEIIEILDTCHIFLAPSVTSADGNQDAPVNTLKEAMAMGLPVISTYHGGIPELVEDGVSGFLVSEKDADAIAQKLAYLIEHPQLWEQMGSLGRRRVEEKYDMEKLNDELVQIYQNLLPSAKTSPLPPSAPLRDGTLYAPPAGAYRVPPVRQIKQTKFYKQKEISTMQQPQVTIVVVPRERFSYTQQSLESIYEQTQYPFKLVYVDGNSPAKIRRYLEKMAQEKNFQLIRTDYYLSPNHARNIGLNYVDTKYVVFFDNDVIVTPGWLEALVNCAEETDAAVVGPLMCEKLPLHQRIHFAGGESHIVTDIYGKRHIREKMYRQGQQVPEVYDQLQRTETELTEFHLMLVRREIFDRVGKFDEGFFNTKEHLDFCMLVSQAGGKIYFEPTSIATYVPGKFLEWTDMHFFMLRWSDDWTLKSLNYMKEKWNLAEDGYFKNKYKKLGWRRKNTIVKPISKRLSNLFGLDYQSLKERLFSWEKVLNRYLCDRYARKHLQPSKNQVLTQIALSSTPERPKDLASLKH